MNVIQPKPSDLCIVQMHKSPGKHKKETRRAKNTKNNKSEYKLCFCQFSKMLGVVNKVKLRKYFMCMLIDYLYLTNEV